MRLHKDAKVELISRVPLFARCSKQELRVIANLADQIEWPEGKTLIKEGRLGSEFFILIEGTVSVSETAGSFATSQRASGWARSPSSQTCRALPRWSRRRRSELSC